MRAFARERFERLQANCAAIADVRGLGAMNAIEFVEAGDPDRPATKLVRTIIDACVKRGLLVISAGTYRNVIRSLSPLVISDELLGQGLTILEEEVLRHAGSIGPGTAARVTEVPAAS